MIGLGFGFGFDILGSNVNQPPRIDLISARYGDSLLGAEIIKIGSDYYIKAKTGANLLITNYDFYRDNTGTLALTPIPGLPFKSDSTIDIFGQTGVKIQSLFNNFDYANQYFCSYKEQVLDANGVEMFAACVKEIVVYSDPLTGDDLVKANLYFGVPEKSTDAVWLSPNGNDSTGAGTEASPYRSIEKIKATTKSVVYFKSGDYTLTTSPIYTGNPVTFIGIGKSTYGTYAGTIGQRCTRGVTFKGLQIDTHLSQYGFYSSDGIITIERCNIRAETTIWNVKGIISLDVAKTLLIKNSVWTGYVLRRLAASSIIIDSCLINGLMYDNTNIVDSIINSNFNDKEVSNINVNFKGNKVYQTLRGTQTSVTFCKLLGVDSTVSTFNDNTVIGQLKLNPVNNLQVNRNIVTATNITVFECKIAASSNITGVEIKNNSFIGNRSSLYIVYIGGIGESVANAINGLKFHANYVVNNYVGTGACHTIFIGGGVNNSIKYNYIIAQNGYGLVLKAGGGHYTTTDAHISYNIIKHTGICSYSILNRGAFGVICANNTIVDFKNDTVLGIDDDAQSLDNSMLCINNNITLSGNAERMAAGTNITSRNNTINKKGFTLTNAIGSNDFETSVVIDSNGIPALKIEHAETIAGDNNVGLAANYSIPNAITYQNQAATWQNGAVVLP